MVKREHASWVVRQEPEACVLIVRGELEIANADAFADAGVRLASSGQRLVIDLTDVTFVDSTGLRALLRIHAAAGPCLALRRPSAPVRRLLNLTVGELFAVE